MTEQTRAMIVNFRAAVVEATASQMRKRRKEKNTRRSSDLFERPEKFHAIVEARTVAAAAESLGIEPGAQIQ